MDTDVAQTLNLQSGVISRRQALAMNMQPHDIRRMLRRGDWVSVHQGVYVDHSGKLSWLQRAWAAVLYATPAALCLDSALRAADWPTTSTHDDGAPIQIAVSRRRATLTAPDGVRIHHRANLQESVLWNVGPPRMRYEEAALDVACRAAAEFDAIAVLANACQSRRTTAQRLLQSLDARQRVRRRSWLRSILQDISEGTCSVLEHGYLTRVERPHRLPRATRQRRSTMSVGVCYRDAEYGGRLVVELDGRMFHDSVSRRNADFERDLDAAADGRSTVRLSYQQVFERPCRTATKIAQVLRRQRIAVQPRPCGPTCEFARLDRAA